MRAKVEGLLETNEKTFKEFAALLNPQQQEEIRGFLQSARSALKTENADLEPALEKLSRASQILTEIALYDPNSLGVT